MGPEHFSSIRPLLQPPNTLVANAWTCSAARRIPLGYILSRGRPAMAAKPKGAIDRVIFLHPAVTTNQNAESDVCRGKDRSCPR